MSVCGSGKKLDKTIRFCFHSSKSINETKRGRVGTREIIKPDNKTKRSDVYA